MSDDAPLRYDFAVHPGSTYERAAALIASARLAGLVVDLGAGVGALAEAMAPYGFETVGFDGDPANVAAMIARGRRAERLDLTADDAAERIATTIDDAPVAAVVMLDVIEHLPDPERSMALLGDLVERFAAPDTSPLLVLSVPNIAHRDLAAKLLLGRWDVTPTGLLDSTHITLFTERRLTDLTTARGFTELARNDVLLERTEQHVADLAVFDTTTLAQHLRALRRRFDRHADVYQFVRSYERTDAGVATVRRPEPTDGPFCSVIVRTQGERPMLVDALVSLAAQRDRDFEVLLMVHADERHADRIRELAATFEPGFAERIQVHQVSGGGRSAPLNAALDVAAGRYVAVLDDDDVVTSDWIASFRRAAERLPGRAVRSLVAVQWVEQRTGLADFEPVSGFETPYPQRFDFLDSVRTNRTPSCALAFPNETVRALGVRFDETLRVCEDWKFQREVVGLTGVSDDGVVTSVYRRWRTGGGSQSEESADTWIVDHERVVDDLDDEPTLVPAGSMRRIHELYRRIEQLEVELGRRVDDDPPFRFGD